ncbi:MAG: HutD family protein [Clostridia bacterium]|nr:HutD family protein [Clostridia bacterium]
MNIIRKDSLNTTTWSGGTTTELRIMPEDGVYSERRFDFRVSTATVEAGESTFTSLPGVQRHLMILEGIINLRHQGMEPAVLNVFEQDTFDGGVMTQSMSEVPVVDFNLMLKPPFKGRLVHHACVAETVISALGNIDEDQAVYRDIYCAKGPVEIVVGNHSVRLFTGDYLQLQGREICTEIQVNNHGDLIEVNVWSE